jgi:heat shock protein HslJ
VWLAGCGAAETGFLVETKAPAEATVTPATPLALEGTEWQLVSLHGADPPEGTGPTMAFYADEYLEGRAGCNTFGTDYVTRDHEFAVAEIHRTRFECDEPAGIAQWEAEFFEAMATITAYRASEDRLAFDNAAEETILVYKRKLPAAVDPALQDTAWTLSTLKGAAPIEGPALTLILNAQGFEGYAGCNHFGGQYEAADEGMLELGVFAITQMDCPVPEGIIPQEESYVKALQEVTGYRLEDGRLELQDAGGEVILVYVRQEAGRGDSAELWGTVWQLVSLAGKPPLGISPITLAFHDGHLASGHAGCWDYVASYSAGDSRLGFHYLGMLGEACPPATTGQLPQDQLMEQEGDYTTMLGWTNRFRLEDGRLELHTVRDETMTFKPLPAQEQASLVGPIWRLLAFVEPNPHAEGLDRVPLPAPVLPGTEITALFAEEEMQGSAGCNDYGATVRRDGTAISIDEIVATERACLDPEDLEVPAGSTMEQEARTFEFLRAVTHYALYGQQLWLWTDDGRALAFSAQQ